MLTDAELAGMRDTSQAALPDNVRIERPAPPGDGDLDPDTGVWTQADPDLIWQGKGRVRPPTAEDIEVLFGDEQVTKLRFIGTFPFNIPVVEVEDVVIVTSSSDPHVTGRTFKVTSVSGGSWLIDRRVALEVAE